MKRFYHSILKINNSMPSSTDCCFDTSTIRPGCAVMGCNMYDGNTKKSIIFVDKKCVCRNVGKSRFASSYLIVYFHELMHAASKYFGVSKLNPKYITRRVYNREELTCEYGVMILIRRINNSNRYALWEVGSYMNYLINFGKDLHLNKSDFRDIVLTSKDVKKAYRDARRLVNNILKK